MLLQCQLALNQVGEWEVKHALRQGEEELRGKPLASREKIDELLGAVRRELAGQRASRSPRPNYGEEQVKRLQCFCSPVL